MGKNLKDIVDEGFSQLAVLAEKRYEVLARAEQIGKAASGAQGDEAEQTLKLTESSFLREMNLRVEQLLQELHQTLLQVSENSNNYQNGMNDSLRQQVESNLDELAQTRNFILNVSRGRLDSALAELESEFQSDKRIIDLEATKLLSNLENVSHTNHTALVNSQTEIAARVSVSEHEISALLGKAFNHIVQGAETKRQEVSNFLDNLYKKQSDKLDVAIGELDAHIAPLVRQQCDSMKDACHATEQNLKKIRDEAMTSSGERLQGVDEEPYTQLTAQKDGAQSDLSAKLAALREISAKMLQAEKDMLAERNIGITGSAAEIYETMANPNGTALGPTRSRLDEAFSEIALELTGLSDDLAVKFKDLLTAQGEGLSRLSSSTDKGFSDLFNDFRNQIKELLSTQEQLCAQKEEELFLHLQRLEEQIDQTYSLLRTSGFTGKNEKGSANGGGVGS